MTIGVQGRTLFIEALAAAIKVPQREIRLRIRSVSEAGLLPKGTEPFLARHGVAVLLAIAASPTHADAGRIVPKFLALPRRQISGAAVVKRVLPSAMSANATFGSVLSDVLRNKTASHIRELLVVWPPHESAIIVLTGSDPSARLHFGQATSTKSGPTLEHTVLIPSSALAAAASAIMSE